MFTMRDQGGVDGIDTLNQELMRGYCLDDMYITNRCGVMTAKFPIFWMAYPPDVPAFPYEVCPQESGTSPDATPGGWHMSQ